MATLLIFSTLLPGISLITRADTANEISMASVVSLQKFLTASSTLSAEEALLFDMNSDGKLNGIDLTLMKRQLIYPADSLTPAKLLNQVLASISASDEDIPPYAEDLYEISENVYLFTSGENTYAYTLLSSEETDGASLLNNLTDDIKGLHVWLYSGSNTPVSVTDAIPDATDLVFVSKDSSNNDIEYPYNLKTYDQITISDILEVTNIIAKVSEENYEYTSFFDYNLDGILDKNDLTTMVRYFTSKPMNMFPNLDENLTCKYFNNISVYKKHTNVVVLTTSSSEPVEYAFNIPTGELIDKIAPPPYVLPVQIISPYEYYYEITPYFDQATDLSDEQFDFMAWMSNTLLWAKVSTNSEIWNFDSGIYIYVLKDDGTHLLEWIGY